jgi:hypothetical protein
MAERMTSIVLPGAKASNGYSDWGRKTVPEMIETIRAHAHYQFAAAQEVLAASDADFKVETHLGVNCWSNIEVLQEGRKVS